VVGYKRILPKPSRLFDAGRCRSSRKRISSPYPYAVKQITRVIKQAGRIIIMPEGMSSISGANQPCAVGSGQLFKYLGVPVRLYQDLRRLPDQHEILPR
jgi:hypothetical protein